MKSIFIACMLLTTVCTQAQITIEYQFNIDELVSIDPEYQIGPAKFTENGNKATYEYYYSLDYYYDYEDGTVTYEWDWKDILQVKADTLDMAVVLTGKENTIRYQYPGQEAVNTSRVDVYTRELITAEQFTLLIEEVLARVRSAGGSAVRVYE